MRVWLQQEFPWYGYGFIGAVSEHYAGDFEAELRKLGFTVVSVNAGTTKAELHESLLDSLLPDADHSHAGHASWDALHDDLRDMTWPPRLALLLRRADDLAAADPKGFGEACAFLTSEFKERDSEGKQCQLIVTGEGPTFHDPDHPSPDKSRLIPR